MCVKVLKQKHDVLPAWDGAQTWQRDANVSFLPKQRNTFGGSTHLAHVHLVSVFACSGAICSEDSCAVAIGIVVD